MIQLCDCLSGSDKILDMEDRMTDVENRYGNYPENKWNYNMKLKKYFESMAYKNGYPKDKNIYDIVEKNKFSI